MQKISIITVNFNNKNGLYKTIESVQKQTYSNIEYIVIDGGSTDGSKELIEKNAESLSYWVSEKDKGIYDGMNKGLGMATGDYCLFLNSGDYLMDNNVLSLLFDKTILNEDLIIGRQKFINERGRITKGWRIDENEMDERFLWHNTLPHQATFIKTAVLKEIGGYDLNYPVCADWVSWHYLLNEKHCTYKLTDTFVSIMEQGGTSSDMSRCHKDMCRFLKLIHPDFSEEDWSNLNEMYGYAKLYKRATASPLSKMLTKVAIFLNKK